MTRLLEKIKGPEDLQQLSNQEMAVLAAELRQRIIDVVSKNGGHLASNLGVVELTLALHSVYRSPTDKLIWDVGHQCYVHKILTGRNREFHTLRQLGGIAGFPKGSESIHDAVETGHSSTSVSTALGMALARDMSGDKHNVVAVIGDGALGGGMAFEALNHAGELKVDMTVVLNDNEMSIARNVGALSSHLSNIRTNPRYNRVKRDAESLLHRIPWVGSAIYRTADRIKDSLKYLLVSGMLFENLGFTYLGPIDGHNLIALRRLLTKAKSHKGPVLVHVITTKGKGYQPAEDNPARFHGIGAFDKKSGKPKAKPGETYTSVFGNAMCRLAEKDPRLVDITAAMPDGTGLAAFADKYPRRFFDTGIAEQHAVTMAAGLARSGYRPVVAIYSTFLQRAYDQVLHDVCLPGLPVVIALDRAGLVGDDGETHHGVFDISMLRNIPGLTIMMPKDLQEFEKMLTFALEGDRPVALRYPRGGSLPLPVTLSGKPLEYGRGELLREGRDVTLVGLGPTLSLALEAQAVLASRGISAAVVNPRFVKPLDSDLLQQTVGKTGRLVVVEEHVRAGGLGSAILEHCQAVGMNPTVKLLGIDDDFVSHGPVKDLRRLCGLTVENVVLAAEQLMTEREQPWLKKGWT